MHVQPILFRPVATCFVIAVCSKLGTFKVLPLLFWFGEKNASFANCLVYTEGLQEFDNVFTHEDSFFVLDDRFITMEKKT